MTVTKLPHVYDHPGHPADYDSARLAELPPQILDAIGMAGRPMDAYLGIHHAPKAAAMGAPLSVLEDVLRWERGSIARWGTLPYDDTWGVCARLLGDRVATGTATAIATAAIAMHKKALEGDSAACLVWMRLVGLP
jgi:hypothetical protein